MSKNLEIKKTVVAEIKEKFDRAQTVVLVDYRGLNVAEDTELRNQLRKAGVEYAVLKNTMINLAIEGKGIDEVKAHLEGPTAVAFSMNDPASAAKIISEFAKKTKKTEVKAGLLGTEVLDVKGVQALADLPPKEVLIARIMGSLNAPITNFVGVLSATLRSLVYAIDAVRKSKEEG